MPAGGMGASASWSTSTPRWNWRNPTASAPGTSSGPRAWRALGATEKGLFGLEPQNRPATRSALRQRHLRAGGDAAGWVETAHADRRRRNAGHRGQRAAVAIKQLINRLAALVELPPPGGRCRRTRSSPKLSARRTTSTPRAAAEASFAGHRPENGCAVRRLDHHRPEGTGAVAQDSGTSHRRQRGQRLPAVARRGGLCDRPRRRRRGGGQRRRRVLARTAAVHAARGGRALPGGDSHRRPSRLADPRRGRPSRAPRRHRHAVLRDAVRRGGRAGRVRQTHDLGEARRTEGGIGRLRKGRSTRCSPPPRRRNLAQAWPPRAVAGCRRSRRRPRTAGTGASRPGPAGAPAHHPRQQSAVVTAASSAPCSPPPGLPQPKSNGGRSVFAHGERAGRRRSSGIGREPVARRDHPPSWAPAARRQGER